MKKIILTMFIAAATLTVGCSDAYDIEQKGVVTDETRAFNTPKDFEKAINSLYASFAGESEVSFVSYFTDELGIGLNNAGQGVNDGSYSFALLAGNGDATTIWTSHYNVVNRINRMLNRMDQIAPAGDSSFDLYRAQLHGLRAYCHYKVFAYFTPDYTNPNGLSVIKFDFLQTDDYSRFEERSTVAEIVAFIEDDIRIAKQLVTDEDGFESNLNTTADSGYISNALLEAVLIKMYSMLQTGDAYNKLEEAFNRLTAYNALGDVNEFTSIFSGNGNGPEAIFKLNRVSSDGGVTSGVANAWYPARVAVGELVYMEMGRSLYNELDELDPAMQGTVRDSIRKDARYELYVLPGSKVAVNYSGMTTEQYRENDVLLIGKYPGITNRPLMNDVFVFRFTDMLLALAEKRAFEGNFTGNVEIGDYSNVESIIYNIRSNRNMEGIMEPVSMPTNFSSAQQCYARILEERRIDFAFEGKRYLDMKRLGVRAGSPGFVRDSQDCVTTGVCSLEATSTKLTLPIPRAEIMANPNMVQNPGY